MIKKLRKIALGTVAIAVVILVATGPVVTQVWSQTANSSRYERHTNERHLRYR